MHDSNGMPSENNSDESAQCVLCGHVFQPGNVVGGVYCPRCGRRFNPYSMQEDTVLLAGIDDKKTDSGQEKPAEPVSQRHVALDAQERFGDYDILEEVARGGMGVVYRARQRVLKRIVALKVLRAGDEASPEERDRLLREAKAAAGLTHPNIVPIHEFSIWQGRPYFTMDFIEGLPLDRKVEAAIPPVRESMAIIETVARAIGYAHSKGIIHRDLKPANIIIDQNGQPHVTDFGLAADLSSVNEDRRLTRAGAIMGTIAYIPPEQASGKVNVVDERSDVYSLGAILYEMLTGQPPFTGFTQFELLRRVINQDPPEPRSINPRIHRDAETICMKCLEKDHTRRYASAVDLADDCQAFLRGETIKARPATIGYRLWRLATRRPTLIALAACVLILLPTSLFAFRRSGVLEREKKATEQALENTLAMAEEIAREKAEAEKQVRREWRPEFSVAFDYSFRWDPDPERARRMDIPSLDIKRARILSAPYRLEITSRPVPGNKRGSGDQQPSAPLGLPFSFPRDLRLTVRARAPADGAGDLVLLLDSDRSYRMDVGTTVARLGSATRPGAVLSRGEAILKEDASFIIGSAGFVDYSVERSDGKIRIFANGNLVLDADDTQMSPDPDNSFLALDVRDGSLEFTDLSVDVKSMSRSLVKSLLETANNLASRGRSDLSLRLYESVLLEPIEPPSRLSALRGYARALWTALPRSERDNAGIERACSALKEKLTAAGRSQVGEMEFLTGLALAVNPYSLRSRFQALDKFELSASLVATSGDADNDYGDLSRYNMAFVYLRQEELDKAAALFSTLLGDGTIQRLQNRFSAETFSGTQVGLLLENIDRLLKDGAELSKAEVFLRAASLAAPTSQECAQRYRTLSLAREKGGDIESALRATRRAKEMAPDWFAPLVDEIRLLFVTRGSEEGNAALEKAKTALPQSLELQLALARLYLDEFGTDLRDPRKAEEAALTAVWLSQRLHPGALELLSRAQMLQNRHQEALANMNLAFELEKTEARAKLLADMQSQIQSALPKQGP